MDSKALIAIVVVAIVVVAGAAAVVIVGNGSSSSSSDNPVDCKLRVLGNANNDNYLDKDDVSFIQDIADKGAWDRKTYPLADANNDGIVDSSDVALVNKFLAGTSSTMYYLDWNNTVSSVQYPLSSVLGTSYGIYTEFSTGLDMGIILGIYDKFTYMANGDIGPSDLDSAMYPNADKMTQVGIKSPGLEAMYSGGVRILTGDPKFLGGYAGDAEALGFTVIKLPENRTINDVDCIDTLVTLGVMFNLQNKTADFIDFYERVTTKIANAVEKADVKALSYVIPYTAPGYLPEIYVDAHGSGSMVTADVTLLEMLPVKSKMSTTAVDGFDKVDAESIVALNPDLFVVSMFGYSSSKSYTADQIKTIFKDFVELGFDKSAAGKNGMVFAMPFENCSLAGISTILVLASMIWPDEFNSGDAWDMMQEYYDNFTNFKGDVKESKFAPLSYTALKG